MPQHRQFYVTDTHPFVWYLADDPRLGQDARKVFDKTDDGEATIIIPAVALAEAVYIAGKGRVQTAIDKMLSIAENAARRFEKDFRRDSVGWLGSRVAVRGLEDQIEGLLKTFEIVSDKKFLAEVKASLREALRGKGRSIKEILCRSRASIDNQIL